MAAVTNISAYKFAPLDHLPVLRQSLLAMATTLELKGTVLLSPEGINVVIAGAAANVTTFVEHLRSIPGLEDLMPKKSQSTVPPFRPDAREDQTGNHRFRR